MKTLFTKKNIVSLYLIFIGMLVFAQNNSDLQSAIDFYNQHDYENAKIYLEKAKENQTENTKLIILVYSSKIQLIQNSNNVEIAKQVVNDLIKVENLINASTIKGLPESYYATRIQCFAILSDWDNVNKDYLKLSSPDSYSSYYAAVGFYKNNLYDQAIKLLINNNVTEAKILLANIYSHQKRYEESRKLYEVLYKDNLLSVENSFEYANVLYNLQEFDKAIAILEKEKIPQSYYLLGLCYYSNQNYKKARENLDFYFKNYAQKYGYQDYCEYYIYSCDYMLGNYKKTYEQFADFAARTLDVNLCRQSYKKASQAAVICKNYQTAAELAEKLILVTLDSKEKQEAIIFCSEIYTQSGNYDKAINLLNGYTHDKNVFSLDCSYRIAQIYELKGQYEKADGIYGMMCIEYASYPQIEEIMYKRGEMYYSQGNYKTCAERFIRYIAIYPNGKFIESAYYYCAESELNIKSFEKSIMHNNNLISKFPDSVYEYGAYKNLLFAYESLGKTEESLKVSDILLKKYSEQAKKDGIQNKKSVLQDVKNGSSLDLANTKVEYKNNGESTTKNGRLVGYKLVKLYDESGFERDAKFLCELLYNQNVKADSEECYYAAENALVLAEYYNSDSKKQAQIYLKATELFRKASIKSEDKAAFALYQATDKFVQSQLYSDAKATSQTLKQLYPQSKYAKNVDALIDF